MKDQWLLTNDTARALYHSVARELPIIDYHNHLSLADIANNRQFESITALWIAPDPYKHRAMRILGVPERLITGDASPFEKFEAWYASLPKLIGNPLYDWSIMEFEQVLELSLTPFDRPTKAVWEDANERLLSLSALDILEKFNVAYCAPCATLCDDLSVFKNLDDRFAPSLRADELLSPTLGLIEKLQALTETRIFDLSTFLSAVEKRLNDFTAARCRYTDHALDNGFRFIPDDGQNENRFACVLEGKALNASELQALSSYLLVRLASLYAKHSLNMQLHIGAQRSTSTRLRKLAGAAGGFAAIGNSADVASLTALLDAVEQAPYGLPKTLLFCLNPTDNATFSVLCGSYSKDGVPAIVSQGPSWWWCDHRQGMRDMLEHFSVYGVLSSFVGMTTDSRSLLSFVRHDYFRRILCDWIGTQAEALWQGADFALLSSLVQKLCYENAAKTVFQIDKKKGI